MAGYEPVVIRPKKVTTGVPMSDLSAWTPPASAKPYIATIRAAEIANIIPKNLLTRLLYQESRFRDDIITGQITSPVGAIGIAQVMPATARDPGFGVPPLSDPLDPKKAIPWAAAYLKALKNYTGSWDRALAAYNWGAGYVKKAVDNYGENWLDSAPLETRNYVTQIGGDIPEVFA